MTEFLNSMTEILKSFVYGLGQFWNWLTTPWFTYSMNDQTFEVGPLMLFGLTGLMIVAAVMLIKFLNPVN